MGIAFNQIEKKNGIPLNFIYFKLEKKGIQENIQFIANNLDKLNLYLNI